MNCPAADHPGRVRQLQTAEPIRENLIHNAAAEPCRGGRLLIDRQLPALHILSAMIAGAVKEDGTAVLPEQPKPVPHQFRLRRCGKDTRKTITIAVLAGAGEFQFCRLTGKFPLRYQNTAGPALPAEGTDGLRHGGTTGDSAVGLFAGFTAGIKHKGIKHGKPPGAEVENQGISWFSGTMETVSSRLK